MNEKQQSVQRVWSNVKKMERWKKVMLFIVTVIVLLRTGYIVFRGEVDRAYYTSGSYDLSNASRVTCQNAEQIFTSDKDRLNSLELLFDNISEDKAGAVVLGIYSENKLIYQTNISLSGVNNREWKKIYVNGEISRGKEYKILCSATENCTRIPDLLVVDKSWAPEIRASYSDGKALEGQIAVRYGYLQFPGRKDRLAMCSLWVLLWMAVFAGLYSFGRMAGAIRRGQDYLSQQVKPQVFVAVFEVICCMIITGSSGITFQEPTKVILYLISLIAAFQYPKKSEYIKGLADRPWKKYLLRGLYCYAAFALVGQRIWIYPLTVKLTLAGLFVFLCTVAWFVPVIRSAFYYLEQACSHGFSAARNRKAWQFTALSVLLLLVPATYNLFANNPGISSPDTVGCMVSNAQNLRGMYDWHPAFYCMVLRAIEKIWNSTYAVILVQYFFWAYVMTELLLYLRRKGIRESILVAVALFSGANAGNYVHLNTIWKDIPYTLSLFWSLILVAKLSIDFEEYRKKWYIYLELVIALVGVCLYRKNGIVSFIIVVIPLGLALRKNRKLLAALAASIFLVFMIKGPLYDYYEIKDSGRNGMYIGLGQDILGVYYAGGEVSESTLEMITVMTNYNNAEYSYTPTWSNQSYGLDVDPKDFILGYLDTFVKNPVLMARAVIAREDALWDIYAGQDAALGCVNYTGTMDGVSAWNQNYPGRNYVSLYPVASAATTYTAASQWISAIAWRCGLFMLAGLTAVCFLMVKTGRSGRRYLLITVPGIGHIMSLLLSTGWSDFRYFWPMNLLNMGILLLAIVIVGREGQGQLAEQEGDPAIFVENSTGGIV